MSISPRKITFCVEKNKKKSKLWDKFYLAEKGSHEAEQILQTILNSSNSRNEMWIVYCSANIGGHIEQSAIARLEPRLFKKSSQVVAEKAAA